MEIFLAEEQGHGGRKDGLATETVVRHSGDPVLVIRGH